MNLEEAAAEVGGEVRYLPAEVGATDWHGWIKSVNERFVMVRYDGGKVMATSPEDLKLIGHAPSPTSTLRTGAPSAWTPEMPDRVSSKNGFPDDYWEGQR